MDGCFLNLQLNKVVDHTRWSVGFPEDKVVYPISDEVAQALLHLAGRRVPGGWTSRILSKAEINYLKEQYSDCPLQQSCDSPAVVDNVERFVSDMGDVWAEKQPQILATAHKLNATINSCNLSAMEAIFSLAMTTLMGAAAVGASGPHVAGLVLKIADHIKMQVDHIPITPITGRPN